MIDGPRPIRSEEIPQMEKLVNACFVPNAGRMFARWPHIFNAEDPGRNSLVIAMDGKVVSHTACIPQILKAGRNKIPIIGVSSVATFPEYRGHGLMGKLLDASNEKIRSSGAVLTYLWGDRIRYGRYGWESSGQEWFFTVTPKSLPPVEGKNAASIKRFEGAREDVGRIAAVYDKHPYGMVRSPADHERILNREGWDTWLTTDKQGHTAYMTLALGQTNPKEARVWEFDGVPDSLLLDLLRHVFKFYSLEKLEIPSPFHHPANGLFFSISSAYIVQAKFMFGILNLSALLKAFLPEISRKSEGFKGKITLNMRDVGQKATLLFKGSKVVLEDKPSAGGISLSMRETTRLLFGPGSPSNHFNLGKHKEILDQLFPLDFHVWLNNAV